MTTVESERKKYEKIYKFPGYGNVGHGLKIAPMLLKRAKGRGVLGDFGCGRGGSFPTYLAAGFTIQPVDHVDALAPQWRDDPRVLPLVVANLWADELPSVDYGLCTDVMEHIPEAHVSETIANLGLAIKNGCLWSICHVPDMWGKRVGEKLHMTVRPNDWWVTELERYWCTVEVIKTSKGTSIYWTEH